MTTIGYEYIGGSAPKPPTKKKTPHSSLKTQNLGYFLNVISDKIIDTKKKTPTATERRQVRDVFLAGGLIAPRFKDILTIKVLPMSMI